MLFSPLCSGSSGNASYLDAGGVRLLVDAGVTAKRIEELLRRIDVDPRTLDAILITHEHTDHTAGARVLSRRYNLPVYANAECWTQLKTQMKDISPQNVRVFESDRDLYLRSLCVHPFTTPHDSAHSVGFTFAAGGRKLSVMTDIGHVSPAMLDMVAASDLLLMEANHDVDMLKCGAYPYSLKMRILSARGHLSNEDAGRALQKLCMRGVHNVVLGHLSAENNTPALARRTVEAVLDEGGLLDEVFLTVAARNEPCGVFEL